MLKRERILECIEAGIAALTPVQAAQLAAHILRKGGIDHGTALAFLNTLDAVERDEIVTASYEFAEVSEAVSTCVRRCRACGCTDLDCSGCIERTGRPCHWVEADLCSACVPEKQVKKVASNS